MPHSRRRSPAPPFEGSGGQELTNGASAKGSARAAETRVTAHVSHRRASSGRPASRPGKRNVSPNAPTLPLNATIFTDPPPLLHVKKFRVWF